MATPRKPNAVRGRPRVWSQAIEDEILLRLSHGEPLSKICRDAHMPAETTVYTQEDRDPSFSGKVTRARERAADHYSHEIIEIADEIKTLKGKGVDQGAVQRNRLRIDTRIKLMQMLKRKTYGDKLDLNHGGSVGIQLVNDIPRPKRD